MVFTNSVSTLQCLAYLVCESGGRYVYLYLFYFLYKKGLNDVKCQRTESYQNADLHSLLDSLPKVCYLAGSKVFLREPLAGLLYFCLHSKEVFEYFQTFLCTFIHIVFISVIFLQFACLEVNTVYIREGTFIPLYLGFCPYFPNLLEVKIEINFKIFSNKALQSTFNGVLYWRGCV